MSRDRGPRRPPRGNTGRDDGGRDDGGRDDGIGIGPKLAIAKRELASLRSEKTIVLALCIQLFIAGFSSFLVVGLVSMYDPSGADDVETELAVTGDAAGELLEAASTQDGVSARSYPDRASARAAFDEGRVAAVVDANRNEDDRIHVSVTAPDEGIETTLLIVQLRDTLEALEYEQRADRADRLEATPLAVPSEIGASPYVTFTYTILIPLLLFLPVFICGSIAVDSMIEERQRGTLELLRVAPPSFADVVDAKLLATAGLAPVQAVAWLVLLAFNGTAIARPAALVVLVSALALAVVAGGIAVALSARDRRQAQLWYSGGIVAALVVGSNLPEHPGNTIAKLAIGAPTRTTWALVAAYAVVGAVAFLAVRSYADRLDPETL